MYDRNGDIDVDGCKESHKFISEADETLRPGLKINAIKPESPKPLGDDPNATRKEQRAMARHKNVLWLHKMLPRLVRTLIVFICLLFLVILPLSEMTLEYNSFWEGAQDWARAFRSTAMTALIAMFTLIISAFLKWLLDYLKEHFSDKD